MSGLNGMVSRRKSNSSFMKACFECFYSSVGQQLHHEHDGTGRLI